MLYSNISMNSSYELRTKLRVYYSAIRYVYKNNSIKAKSYKNKIINKNIKILKCCNYSSRPKTYTKYVQHNIKYGKCPFYQTFKKHLKLWLLQTEYEN